MTVLDLKKFNMSVNYEHYGPMLFMIPRLLDTHVIVETGLMYANSTNIFLTSMSTLPNPETRVLHTYDSDTGNPACTIGRERTLAEKYPVKWELHNQDSVQGGHDWNGPQIDFLYLDSDHGVDHVYNKLNAWVQHLSPTAIIISDDTWLGEYENGSPDLALQGMRRWLGEHPEWHEFTFTYPKGQTVLYR